MTDGGEHSERPRQPGSGTRDGRPRFAGRSGNGHLPADFAFRGDPGVEPHPGTDGRTVLLGGQPLRLLRLSARSAQLHDALAGGRPLADAAAETGVSLAKAEAFARRLLDASILHPVPPPIDMTADPDVTLVIPVKDRQHELDRLLTAIALLRPQPTRTVVVDDGSSDAAATADVAQRHHAHLVRHDAARGPAAARNAGAAHATTSVLAFIDSDCVPAADWLACSLAHLADPAVVAVAPRITALNDDTTTPLRAYESVRSSLDLGSQPGPVVPTTRIAYVPSAALVIRRDAFERIGGFDEALHVGEDVDAIWRLHADGGTVRYEPTTSVAHDHRDTLRSFTKRRAQYGTSAAPLARRHPGQVPPLVISPWTAASWTCLATQTLPGLLSALMIAEGSARQLPAKLTGIEDAEALGRRLARRGHLGAGRQLASALLRTYLPLALLAAVPSRRARHTLVAAAIVPNVLEWRERRPSLDPVRFVGLRLLDDASYCAGVWLGCVRERSVDALRPRVVNWPGRRKVSDDA